MAASAKENNVRKIRKFGAGGSTEEDAQEARDKAAGLAASNAELERGDRKPSGFLGLGRFLQGNIDQKGSEAYNLYGAGYGREVEAKNAQLKAATLKDAADNEKRISDAARKAEDAKSEARIKAADKRIADGKARADKSDIADMKQSASSARAVAAPEATPAVLTRGITVPKAAAETKAPAAETKAPAPSTTPEKGDGGGRDSSRFKKVSAAKAAAATKSVATSSDSTRERSSREEAYKKADAEARSPEGQAKRKKIIELQAIENFSPELEVAGGLGGLGLKAAAKLLKRGSGKGFFRKDPEFDYPRVRRGELPAPKKSDSANPSNLSLPKPAPRLGLPRPKGDDIADVVAKRKGGSVQGYASGGSVAASSRGDGIAQRGKTRGRMR